MIPFVAPMWWVTRPRAVELGRLAHAGVALGRAGLEAGDVLDGRPPVGCATLTLPARDYRVFDLCSGEALDLPITLR